MELSLFDDLPNPLFEYKYAVLDFETTGLYPAVGDEIVEIGVVMVENGKLGREYAQLVNPGRDMDPAAIHVSGIKPEDLVSKPPFEDIAGAVVELFNDAVIVAHNAEFDMAFLQSKLVKLGRPQLQNAVLDTLELARANDDSGPNTLGTLANRLGIEGPHAHRALDDAVMAARVLVHFLEEFQKRGQTDLARLPGYRKSFIFAFNGDRSEENSFEMIVDRVRRAIDSQTSVEIVYRGGKSKSTRVVTPTAIKGMNVRGHCHKSNEERDFRLDRIMEMKETETPTAS